MDFVKVIYFDESTVADFMQIISGGNLKKTTEFITDINTTLNSGADGELQVSNTGKGVTKLFSFLTGVKLDATVSGSAEIERNKQRLTKNILENTLLADFLELIEKDKKRKVKLCSAIELKENLRLYPYPNSFSFFRLAAPYFSMIKGDIPINDSDGNSFILDITKMGEAISKGRGYYEFLADVDDNCVIFRFNADAFRNNYTMSDLPKMELSLFSIKVGSIDVSELDITSEFEFGVANKDRVEYQKGIISDVIDNKIDVYDVLLAGVMK